MSRIAPSDGKEETTKPTTVWAQGMEASTLSPFKLTKPRAKAQLHRTSSSRNISEEHAHLMSVEKHSHLMLHPASSFLTLWNLFSIAFIAYIVVAVPFLMVFTPSQPGLFVFDIIVELFFICDVVVNFRTGFYPISERGDIVCMEPEAVAKNYLRTWFALDFISSFPLTSLRNLSRLGMPKFVGSHVFKLFKLLRFFKTAKALRVAKSDNAFSRVLDNAAVDLLVSHPGIVPMLKLLSLVIVVSIVVHYVACGWWAAGMVFDNKSWAAVSGARDLVVKEQYLYSVYWVLTTMTTVGYGDVTAKNGLERAFSVFAMVLGGATYGYIIAKINSVVADADAEARADSMRLSEIASYVNSKKFPVNLQRQVIRYYRNFLKKDVGGDEGQIIRDLSGSLRTQVMNHIVSTVVSRSPLFTDIQTSLSDLVQVMQLQYIDRGHYITQKGQPSNEMVILASGTAVVLAPSRKSSASMNSPPLLTEPVFIASPGSSFGDQCAVGLDDVYRATLRALTHCDVYVLKNADVNRVLKTSVLRNLRLKLMRSLVFRIQIRSYCVSRPADEAEKVAIEKLVQQLPEDSMFGQWNNVETESPPTLSTSPRVATMPSSSSESEAQFGLGPARAGGACEKPANSAEAQVSKLSDQVAILTRTVESLREDMRTTEARHSRDLALIRDLLVAKNGDRESSGQPHSPPEQKA